MIKSVLRYPGGKSKVAQKLLSLIPPNIKEFREPMVGGGSVSPVLKQTLPHVKVWINDIDYDLVCFWKMKKCLLKREEICRKYEEMQTSVADNLR